MPNYGSARCDGDHERDDFEQKKPRSRGAWSFWESVQYGQYPRCQPGTALLRRTRGAPVAYPAFSSSPLPPSPPAEKTTDRLDEGLARRGIYAGSALFYLGFAWVAVNMLFGSDSNGSSDQIAREWSAWLLAKPPGQWVVGAMGIALIIAADTTFFASLRH
jgi:Domain of Unknown Function (DUF1206)